MFKKSIKKINSKKILLILPILFFIYFVSTICLIATISKLNNIENMLRFLIASFLVVLTIYIFSLIINVINRGKNITVIIFSLLLVFMFSIQLFVASTINKIYNSINEISKNDVTYSTSLIALKDSDIDDIDSVKKYKIGIISNEDSIDGYIIAQEIINENNLDSNNTITEYDSFSELLNALYDKEVDLVFISSNYVTMFANTNSEGDNTFKDIKDETIVITKKTKKVEKNEVVSNESVDKPFTMLIMGVDSTLEDINSGSSFNGDALMLVTFNPNTFNTTILSIPRDTYVPIMCFKDHIENKITHAAWYGESCMISTIENFTGIDIDHYVKINFKGVVKLVDTLGGVYVDVPYSFCEQNSDRSWGKDTVYVEKGYQKLNGEQALALARNRHPNPGKCSSKWTNYNSNDFVRGQNQQLVIKGIINQIKNIKSIDDMTNILNVIQNNMDTSFSTNQILSFYNIGKKLLTNSTNDDIFAMERLYLSGYDKYIYDKNMKLVLYNYIYYKQSLKDIVSEMQINLEEKEPTLIKEFYFSINEEYEKKIIGKGYYNESQISTLPNFIGQSSSVALNWGINNSIKVNIVEKETSIASDDGVIISQNFPYAYLISNINKNTGITVTIGKYVKSSNTDEEEQDENIDCYDKDNKNKSICKIPDFSAYTINMAENWKNNLPISLMVTINKITPLDANYIVDKAGKLYNQSITAGTDITTVNEIIITYYDKNE